jgi:bifunctional lysine-specific demethylase and histidyl-hydroxylase NO66
VTSLVELERAGSTSALARCTGDPAEFLERTWGRRAVVHTGAEPHGFADLLTFDDVDRLLSSTSLRTPAFRLVKAGEQIAESSYTRSGTTGSKPVTGMADPRRVFDLFSSGATIVLQGLHRYHEPVAIFTRELEAELGHACQVNAYITPPGAQGLALHRDPHDVFVLQAFGRKSWEIHAAPPEPDRGPLLAVVESGDAIYMPTGTPHAATTQETLSGHLTVGVHVTSWRDVLGRAWSSLALDEPVPAGWVDEPDAFASELARRLEDAARSLGEVDAPALAEREVARFLSNRPPVLRGALVDGLAVASIDDDTVLRRREGAICEIRRRGERVVVLLGDRRLEMPSWLEPALRRIVDEPTFRVRDLASEIGDRDSRLVFVRRLVREGLLRIGRST